MDQPFCLICLTKEPNKVFSKDGHDIYVCKNCRLYFVHPIPGGLSDIYSSSYFSSEDGGTGYTNYDEDKGPMLAAFAGELEQFDNLVSGRKIFDIGAATGYFLDLAKEMGWQTAGSEISAYAGNEAIARGHKIEIGPIENLEVKETYDVVTIWDVIEHVSDPGAVLKKINRLLKQGGLLAINTPDAGSVLARILGKRWHAVVPPEHLFYFNRDNLTLLLEKNGFKVVEVKRLSKKFSLPYIFKTLWQWQGLGVWKHLASWFDRPFWRQFAIPLNLRDNMYVLARKMRDV